MEKKRTEIIGERDDSMLPINCNYLKVRSVGSYLVVRGRTLGTSPLTVYMGFLPLCAGFFSVRVSCFPVRTRLSLGFQPSWMGYQKKIKKNWNYLNKLLDFCVKYIYLVKCVKYIVVCKYSCISYR